MPRPRCLTLVLALLAAPAARAAAQVTETPVAFDSAGRVAALTQPLAERLRLAAPAWPVLGSFVSARLYARSDGGYTLVVARANGSLDRYALDAAGGDALRGLVQQAIVSGRRAGIGEQTDLFSDPAGNAFVRNQALLGIFVYGPSAAAMVASGSNDPSLGVATELVVAGGAFFAALGRRSSGAPVTTAQNILATHMATRGAGLGAALAYVADAEDRGVATSVFAGAVGGTVLGLARARRMTDAEAASSGFVADLATLTSLGVMGATGAYGSVGGPTPRTTVAIASAALVGGYLVGPAYPRQARYTVTAGDVRALGTTGLLGAAIAVTPFVDGEKHAPKAVYGTLTVGLLGGVVLGDRLLARPYDHTRSEGALLWTGATAGALVGAGVGAAGDAEEEGMWTLATAGALLGVVATEAALDPAPGGWGGIRGGARASDAGVRGITGRRARGIEVHVDPVGAAFAATGKHGRLPVMRVSF